MLDLKAKLASAGLVSARDIERVESEAKRKRDRGRKPAGSRADPTGLAVGALRKLPKGELYAAVRRWVTNSRLDRSGPVPSESAEPFHFPEASGRIGRLMLEPELRDAVRSGTAGIIAYMSNNGLAHAVVTAAGAKDIAELQPQWLRVLDGDVRAGVIDKPSP